MNEDSKLELSKFALRQIIHRKDGISTDFVFFRLFYHACTHTHTHMRNTCTVGARYNGKVCKQ